MRKGLNLFFVVSVFALISCQSVYYKTMETFCHHKRDLLVDRVEDSRDAQLINAMKRAETKIEPVLSAFRDQVLFLKHNLNAQAIASLHDELASVEADIASLIKEMEASIAEANAFIEAMVKG
ncbi:MAG: DUF2959 family protein [Planctomycetota bacterium]|jgi:hypothetical protein